jgi:aspartate/methionine/tyrosine aminotransferase
LSHAVDRLRLPLGGTKSVRGAERELEVAAASPDLLDATAADTKRWPAPAWVLDELSLSPREADTYTPYRGDRHVLEAVAANLSPFLGLDLTAGRNVILTAGTQGALSTALACLVDPGDKVLLVEPDYLSDERILRWLDADVLRVPLLWEREAPAIDLDVLEAGLRNGARLLVLSNPNNPTGTVFSSQQLEQIAALLISYDAFVVVDELYCRLVYEEEQQPFVHLAALPGMQQRSVTLLGPSKTESMSGFRLGVAVAPEPVIDAMEDLQSITVLRAPAYAQPLLKRWLVDDLDFVADRVREYRKLRDATIDHFAASGLIDVTVPAGTTYMFPALRSHHVSEQEVAIALKTRAGVLVNPGYQFGTNGSPRFRICFAQDPGSWPQALDRMRTILDELVSSAVADATAVGR